MVVVLIPLLQIKVMRLIVYLQYQKLAIPSLFLTDSSLTKLDINSTIDSNLIFTGTGTAGATLMTGDSTTGGGTILIGIGIIVLGLIAYRLDRYLNRIQDLDQELTNLDNQNQE